MLGRIFALLVFAFYGFWGQANGQNAKSTVTRAKFSVVDVHSHFRIKLRPTPNALDEFVDLMNRQNIAIAVSLDGTLGPILDEHLQYLWKNHKSRFIVFANIDWQGDGKENEPATWDCNQSDFVHRTVLALQAARQKGISGLKLFKQFGLNYRNSDGSYIAIDDPRFDPIWETCGQLGIPVIMHTADPSAFFEPITARNERYEELSRHPDWHFPSDKFPTRSSLHAARNRIIERHRSTTFIGAHMANDAEDLVETSQLLDAHPNLYIELASRISELGRQPYSARDFLIKYQDRVMFGTDGPWPEPRYRSYWRFLETRDEYFPYAEKPFPPQGFWQIYGVHLPDDVLKKIYSENAKKAIPGVKERL
jgi:predicted TIM-barrel fold metal-dependent hydrolase